MLRMAKAPKCKLCGEAHFGAAHIWPGARVAVSKVDPPPRVVARPAVEPVRIGSTDDALGRHLAEQRALKAAYMRTYRADRKINDK